MNKKLYISFVFGLVLLSVIGQIIIDSSSALIEEVDTELSLENESDVDEDDSLEEEYLIVSNVIHFQIRPSVKTLLSWCDQDLVLSSHQEIQLPPPEFTI